MKDLSKQSAPLCEIENLEITFFTVTGSVRAVRDVSLHINRGEVLGLVGESGCGKSTVAFAIMGYLTGTNRVRGAVRFEGRDTMQIPSSEMRNLRGDRIAMIYQDPATCLNPSMRVGAQIEEVLHQHLGLDRKRAKQRTAELFEIVGLADPQRVGRRYPHELSGGMQQRIVIAMSLACDPHLLIMDEPTTGLDVTTEATILDLVADLKQRVNAGILFVSHNLGVIARVADRVAVMYSGLIVEEGPVRELFKNPRHPYTEGLLSCVPQPPTDKGISQRLRQIPGVVYSAQRETKDMCLFSDRCPIAQDICRNQAPSTADIAKDHKARCFFWEQARPDIWGAAETQSPRPREGGLEPVLSIDQLKVFYGKPRRRYGLFGRLEHLPVRAVAGIDLDVLPGRTLGIVGESGSGKTTLGRAIAGLTPRTSGSIRLQDTEIGPVVEKRTPEQRDALRMIFQNPTASLNPRITVGRTIMRSLQKFESLKGEESRQHAIALLQEVGLDSSYMDRLPKELSGGEQQRIALAVAFAGKPKLIIADEPVSALDVSVQAQVLNFLMQHQKETGSSYIFISHDLGVVRYVSDDILVMYAGHVAEFGPMGHVLIPPFHPYTEALLSAAPVPDPDVTPTHIRLPGSVPTLREAFTGCFFAGRCPRKIGDICDNTPPPARQGPDSPDHVIYCHIPIEDLREQQEKHPDEITVI